MKGERKVNKENGKAGLLGDTVDRMGQIVEVRRYYGCRQNGNGKIGGGNLERDMEDVESLGESLDETPSGVRVYYKRSDWTGRIERVVEYAAVRPVCIVANGASNSGGELENR